MFFLIAGLFKKVLMRILLQRVQKAQVRVENQIVGQIGKGILLFVGITHSDTEIEAKHLAEKSMNLRIFDGADGKKNDLSVIDIKGEVLLVSQFTLYGDCSKGRRPGFDQAANPQKAQKLYHSFIEFTQQSGLNVQTGEFQAMMEVELINDGPVTFLLERP